jgi:homoserine kinase
LPSTVPHSDAAADAGAAALLVAALAGRPDQLWRATRDHLHQEYRRPAMPSSLALVDRLRADGHAAVVSGAGPTVLALVPDGTGLASYCPQGWEHLHLVVDTRGAVVG